MCTLIGIAVEFQCDTNLLAREAAILQEASLPSALRVVARQFRAEAFAAHGANRREPVDFAAAQHLVGLGVADAALRKLGSNTLRTLTFGDARTHERIGEARVGERARLLELVEHHGNDVVRKAAGTELKCQLAAAVLAPRQQRERATRAGGRVPVGRGLSRVRPRAA